MLVDGCMISGNDRSFSCPTMVISPYEVRMKSEVRVGFLFGEGLELWGVWLSCGWYVVEDGERGWYLDGV